MNRFFQTTVLLTIIAVLAGCLSSWQTPALRVGTSPTMAPLVFERDGELAGLEVDLANELATRMARRIEWQVMPFSDLITALERGEIDVIMAGLSVTERRARRILFAEPYMQSGQMLMFRRSDLGTLNSTGAARQLGRPFAVQASSTGESFVLREFPAARIFRFDDTAAMVAALDRGDVDYLVQDAPAIWYYSLRQQGDDNHLAFYRYLTHEQLAWAVSRGDTSLAQELNQALAGLRSDGTLQRLINTWMPVRTALEDK